MCQYPPLLALRATAGGVVWLSGYFSSGFNQPSTIEPIQPSTNSLASGVLPVN